MLTNQNIVSTNRNILLKRALLNKKKKINLKKIPRPRFPNATELFYRKQLIGIVKLIDAALNKILLPKLPFLLKEIDIFRPDSISNNLIFDDFTVDLNAAIGNMSDYIDTNQQAPAILAQTVGTDISVFNNTKLNNTMRSVFGVDIFAQEPWLKSQLDVFALQNVDLITDLSNQALFDLKGIVQRGLASGTGLETLTSQLHERIGLTNRRAKLIARDQTAKLNGQLTELRQTQLGVDSYTWLTAGDERVRPTHEANDGEKFNWDDPPATGHPGSEVNCRCLAVPVLDKLL